MVSACEPAAAMATVAAQAATRYGMRKGRVPSGDAECYPARAAAGKLDRWMTCRDRRLPSRAAPRAAPRTRIALDRDAARDFDDRAVDVGRLVRREPRVGVGDFLGTAEATHRHLVADQVQHLFRHRREDRRLDEARADRVGANALAAELARPGLDHADHAELGRRVVGLAEVAVQADDRRRVEDAARVLREHDVDDRLRAVVDALEIDVDDALELLVGHLGEARVLDDAGVVDQRVDAAPRRHHRLDHPRDAPLVGDVDLEGQRFAPGRANRVGGLLRGGEVDVADGDARAFVRELDRGRAADALAAAGDDGNLVLQSHEANLRAGRPVHRGNGPPNPRAL